LILYRLKNKLSHDKAKPFVRRGRKATGPSEADSRVALVI
jgi:hypothetical protein